MDAVALTRGLPEHRSRVKQLLLGTALCSEEDLRRPFDIGRGTLWRTLTHLYAAEFVWIAAFRGDERAAASGDLPGNQLGEGGFRSLAKLRSRWRSRTPAGRRSSIP